MHMRTTLNLDEKLYQEAAQATGVQEKTRLVHMGLQKLIEESARLRLANMYGALKGAKASPRRRKLHGHR